jgi:hypothetical protein
MEKIGNAGLSPFTTSESVLKSNSLFQDTTKHSVTIHSTPQINQGKSTLIIPLQSNDHSTQKKLDSIFARSEQREKILTRPKKEVTPNVELTYQPGDTSSIKIIEKILPYQHTKTHTDIAFQENFLLGISYRTLLPSTDSIIEKKKISTLLKEKTTHITISPSVKKIPTGIEGTLKSESSFNWIAGLLLLSLFIFSWMKILYEKYILQVIAGIVNYQVSVRLFHEKNVLYKNLSVGLSFIFSINLGLFLFFGISYFNVSQIFPQNSFLCVTIYCSGIAAIYIIKTLSCRFIGYLFLAQAEFSEYVHNINLFNKNVGLFLFPIVIMLPYMNDSIKPAILYSGLIIVSVLFVLRIIRGFQIIIRKGVSTFYLILYLCAVEILPVLLIVKYSSTLI